MPNQLFNRDLVINVGGLRLASRLLDSTRQRLGLEENEVATTLKVVFKVTKTLIKEPNKAELSIFNLRKDNRVAVQKKKQPTTIEAGYLSNASQIFSGDLEFGSNRKDGRHWITTLQAGDGSKNFKAARINTSIKGPVDIKKVLETAGEALGFELGNLKDAASRGSLRGALTELTNGVVLSGKAEKVFDKIVKSMGLGWSVHDSKLLLLGPNDFLGDTATPLAPGTGLVGSPEPGEDGIVKARSLLQPQLLPGFRVQFDTAEIEGIYRIEKATFSGDTAAPGDWYTDIECKPL